MHLMHARQGGHLRGLLSVPVTGESGVVYLRHSTCSPAYLRHLCGAGAADLRRRRFGHHA